MTLTSFRCRFVRPVADSRDFPERIIDREAPELAAQDYHFDGPDFGYVFAQADGSRVRFALVEVEHPNGNRDRFVSKTIHHGIWRAGGISVPSRIATIEGIAEALGWERDPQILLDPWEGEEY